MNYIPKRNIHVLWLTENYFPSKGGMAQSSDRIVNSLRNELVEVDVLHFSSKRQFFKAPLFQSSDFGSRGEKDERKELSQSFFFYLLTFTPY